MSARQSPPRARVSARSRTILAGSWEDRGLRHGAKARDKVPSNPRAPTVSTRSAPPAWPTALEGRTLGDTAG